MNKCGIYKITNLINNKVYIGQSRHIFHRWSEHKLAAKDILNNCPLYLAIRKYGITNFKFEIIEECEPDQLNDREAYYMYTYNSFCPLGYNVRIPTENGIYVQVPDYIFAIIEDLKKDDLGREEISNKYGISLSQVDKINYGTAWHLQNQLYPVRKYYNDWDKTQVIPLLQQGYKTREIADQLNTSKSSVENYMCTNNIHTEDFRKRLTSNKRVILIKDQQQLIFNSIKEAGIYIAQHENILENTAICGLQRASKRPEPRNCYYGYVCKTQNNFIEAQ